MGPMRWVVGCVLIFGCSASEGGASQDADLEDAWVGVDSPRAPSVDAGVSSSQGGARAAARDAAVMDAARAAARDAADSGSEPADASAAPSPEAELLHTRADALLATLMLRFWSSLSANTNTYDWMYAHYWDAVLDAAERRGPRAFAGSARMFYELQDRRGWLDGFYDDENWVTLALLHAHAVTGEALYLERARLVFADIEKAWDETCCGDHKGGLFWKKPRENKVTAINAGAVISAARLYAVTHELAYLDFARKAYTFWANTMVDRQTGHVFDGFDDAGTINKDWKFTYNEGLFIGAIVALARVTGDDSQLPLAHQVAAYMLREESAKTALGSILSDGKCSGDGEMFKAVGARYLGELYALDPSHTEYRDFLRRSADAVWTLARDASTGLVSCDWAGPFDMAGARVGALGAAAVGVAAAARALGHGAQRPALQYEAEEGNLHGVGLEATHAGFSGWGYLAGWGRDGQAVELQVDVEEAGTYHLELRYASEMDAARSLSANGGERVPLRFPASGAYTRYTSLQAQLPLARGRNTLTLRLDTSAGDSGYLNLDRVDLALR
jgi:predicted alpha-1,6-mannanase (GH76 family)